jgi:lipopolysaccharide O-acetyltransferase
MEIKRIFKLLFWNKLQQFCYQTSFRLKGIKRGGAIERGLYSYNIRYVSLGNNVKIKKNWRIECYPTFGHQKLNPQLTIGDNVIINFGFTAFVADKIRIGSNCIFAANVTLISENHGINPESNKPYYAQDLTTGPIEIGEGCWLGQNVSVLPNVSIGEKCIIATNAVVSHNIPAYSIAAGIPAKVIKQYDLNENMWKNVKSDK